jgi:TrpR family trp operon transcriptional repressor
MSKITDQKKSWRRFIRLLLSFEKEQELESFLDLFLTLEEQKDLLNRHAIVQALMFQDQPQRQIAEQLNVSIAKITRGSNCLKTIPANSYAMIKKKIGSFHEKSNVKRISRKS